MATVKKNKITKFDIKPQNDEKNIYFLSSLPIVKVEEQKYRNYFYEKSDVTIEHSIKEQIMTIRDTFFNEYFTQKLDEDGINCVIFPKFKTVIAEKLEPDDRIMLDGKLTTIKSLGYIENRRFVYIHFEESDVAIKVKCKQIFDVVMFKHHTIEEQGFPEAGQKIFYRNELKTIESVNRATACNTKSFYIRFTDGNCTDTFSQDSLLLIASHHLTEDDSLLFDNNSKNDQMRESKKRLDHDDKEYFCFYNNPNIGKSLSVIPDVETIKIGKVIKGKEDFDLFKKSSDVIIFPKTKMINVFDLKIGDKVFFKGDYHTIKTLKLLGSFDGTYSFKFNFYDFDETLFVNVARSEIVMFKVAMFKYSLNIKYGDKIVMDGELKTIDRVICNCDRKLKFIDGTETSPIFPVEMAILTASHHLTEDDAVTL